MTPRSVGHRIFVVGAPRSGTTLVQSLLASHTSLTSFTESHFLSRHYKLLPAGLPPILTRDPQPRLDEFLAENDAPLEIRESAALEMTGARGRSVLGGRIVARAFIDILDRLALSRGVSGWVEKTPAHLRYIPFVEAVVDSEPAPHFVHVVRRGPEVVASLHRASRDWERSYDLRTCADRWNVDVGASLDRVGSPSDRFVFYDELTGEPELTTRRLVESLGLDWERQVLERYGEAAEDVITRDETWKADVGREIRPPETGMRGLSPEDAARVDGWLDSELYDRLRQRTDSESLR